MSKLYLPIVDLLRVLLSNYRSEDVYQPTKDSIIMHKSITLL